MDKKQEKINLLKDEFDGLCNAIAPSKVVLDIKQYESWHLEKVLKDYGRFVQQFELYYDLITEVVMAINYIDHTNWPSHRGVQFILMVHNLKSLYSAFDRLIKGFYEDSIILARPVYEGFIKNIYITCYPNNPLFIVNNKLYTIKIEKSKNFNLTSFIADELKLDWHAYHIFSAVAHSNSYSTLGEAYDISRYGQKKSIALQFQFDKILFELGINYIIFLLLVNLKLIDVLFITERNNILKNELDQKVKKLISLREQSFLLHPKEYWPKVIKDTQDIFTMIKDVEAGQDWKNCWTKIRAI